MGPPIFLHSQVKCLQQIIKHFSLCLRFLELGQTLKWCKFVNISFIIKLEYGILLKRCQFFIIQSNISQSF